MAEPRVFEMRTYFAAPGKMNALHARFRTHTCRLFEKHGMDLIGFWSPVNPDQSAERMVYVLAFSSHEAAAASWQAFQADPEWQAAKAASELNGPLVARVESLFLQPTDYSPLR